MIKRIILQLTIFFALTNVGNTTINYSNCFENILLDFVHSTSFVSKTGLWGISEKQLQTVKYLIDQHLKDDFINLYVIGSRAVGKRSHGKLSDTITAYSDVDFLIHTKHGNGRTMIDKIHRIKDQLKQDKLFPFSMEIHTTMSDNDLPFKSTVMSYHGGSDTYFYIQPQNTPMDQRFHNTAIIINDWGN